MVAGWVSRIGVEAEAAERFLPGKGLDFGARAFQLLSL